MLCLGGVILQGNYNTGYLDLAKEKTHMGVGMSDGQTGTRQNDIPIFSPPGVVIFRHPDPLSRRQGPGGGILQPQAEKNWKPKEYLG